MILRKKGCPLQNIEERQKTENFWCRNIKEKNSGQIGWVTGLFLILFMTVFLYAVLQMERYRAASLYLEDALAASNLASAVVDIEEYGISNQIVIKDLNAAYQRYQRAVRENLNLNEAWEGAEGGVVQGRVRIVNYTVYNVCGDEVVIGSFDETGVKNGSVGILGEVTAPNGVKVESTSVYSEIAFFIGGFPGVNVEARKGNLVDVIRETE